MLVNSYDDTFGVLDGTQEGLYQWMTINFVNGEMTVNKIGI